MDAAFRVQSLLAASPDRTLRRWAEEGRSEHSHVRELLDLASLRASIAGVSPLLLAACETEGISLAAVAHAVRPRPARLQSLYGHPWAKLDEKQIDHYFDAYPSGLTQRWANPRRANSALVRPPWHRKGPWTVLVDKGVLHTDMTTGDIRVRSADRRGELTLPATLPRTALLACRGRPVATLVDHSLLHDLELVITSASQDDGLLRLRFRCEPAPLVLGELVPDPDRPDEQVGRDGRLSGEVAGDDVIERYALSQHYMLRDRDMDCFAAMLRHELRLINLMPPPWAGRLRLPSTERLKAVVEGVIRRMAW